MTSASSLLKSYIDRVAAVDGGTLVGMFSADAVQRVPFAPPGIPTKITGEAVGRGFLALRLMFKSLAFSDVEIVDTSDPELAVGFAHAEATLQTGAPYDQDYVFYVRVRNGKITEYREYMDPQRAQRVLAQLPITGDSPLGAP